MTIQSPDWFTEVCAENGSAFSLRLSEKVHTEKTSFQTIDIYETTHFGTLMVIDGFVMLTDRDNFIYHEMMCHPALFSHPHPRRVVIIGGGDCGSLSEVFKHPGVESLCQVEIDERVTRLAEQYFPDLCSTNNDPRASFSFSDGIAWIRNATAGSCDVVIVDSTDPIGPAEGLFSEAFYHDCHLALGDSGILVHQSESPLYNMDIIKPMITAMRAAGFTQTHTLHFPQCSYPSGWWSATMAIKTPVGEDTFREADARHKSFATQYYNADIHRAAMAAPEFFKHAIETTQGTSD